MATHRSPNCPQITFEEAAQKGRRVYDKEHTHAAPKAAVAEDLGYSGLNGRSLSMIGALRQYGILEGNSESMRITEDAVAYFELEDGPERTDAMLRMIFNPPFFASLRQQFADVLPSEANLKHHLIKEGFLPKAAEEVIHVYRANMTLAIGSSKRYSQESEVATEKTAMATQPSNYQSVMPSQVSPSVYSFSYPLSADTKADLQIRGTVAEEELEMLRDQIEMTIKALKRGNKAKLDVPSKDES